MSKWERFRPGHGRPSKAYGRIDVQYKDGKIFRDKVADNCYWGADTLIEFWRPTQEPPA